MVRSPWIGTTLQSLARRRIPRIFTDSDDDMDLSDPDPAAPAPSAPPIPSPNRIPTPPGGGPRPPSPPITPGPTISFVSMSANGVVTGLAAYAQPVGGAARGPLSVLVRPPWADAGRPRGSGEGGRETHQERLERIARGMGITEPPRLVEVQELFGAPAGVRCGRGRVNGEGDDDDDEGWEDVDEDEDGGEEGEESGDEDSEDTSMARFAEALAGGPMIVEERGFARWFDALRGQGAFMQAGMVELMAFASFLADSVDMLCMDAGPALVAAWGQRLAHLVSIARERPHADHLDALDALAARAAAHSGDFDTSKAYVRAHEDEAGRTRVDAQAQFDASLFHQVAASTAMALCAYGPRWESGFVYLFEASHARWAAHPLGEQRFLVDEKLGEVIGHFRLGEIWTMAEDWRPERRAALMDFIVTVLNGHGAYRDAQETIISLREVHHECPASLVAETIRGLLSGTGRGRRDRNQRARAEMLLEIYPANSPEYHDLQDLFARRNSGNPDAGEQGEPARG